jgi:hypothetical protein
MLVFQVHAVDAVNGQYILLSIDGASYLVVHSDVVLRYGTNDENHFRPIS